MSKKIASIWDKKDDDDDHEHGQEGQAFYAGGSEHSGQQILGPNRRGSRGVGNMVEQLLEAARRNAETNPTPPDNAFPVTFWRNGFTVGDDSELRDYASNRQFIDSLERGEVPPELAARVQGAMIDVKLVKKTFEDFQPNKKPQVFTGEGHRLGAPAPAVVSESNQSEPSTSKTSDESKVSLDEMRLKRLARFSQKPKPSE